MLSVTIILMVVLSIITLTMMTGAAGQLQLSGTTANRNVALEGALAGVQAVVANIRAASISGFVVLGELPCSNVSGETNSSGGSSFVASVQYEDVTPAGAYTKVSCTQGQGPAAPAAGNFLVQAVITSCSPATACPNGPTSAPTDNGTWRRIVSTYDFDTDYSNVPGGLIYSYSHDECLEATNPSDVLGVSTSYLEVTTSCSTSNPNEWFAYTQQWNLQIVLDGAYYCVQDPLDELVPLTSPIPIIENCTSDAVAQWGVNDNGGIQGVATTGSPTGQPYTSSGNQGACLENPNPNNTGSTTGDATVGSTATDGNTCDGSMSNDFTWQMSSAVGAGDSQPPSGSLFGGTNQLVNFQEFGYCMDVTNQDVSSTFLIDYMCKQFPDVTYVSQTYPGYPTWNQRWCFQPSSTGSDTGLLYTPYTQSGQVTTCVGPSSPDLYCLTSPAQQPASQYPSAYVTVTSCDINTSFSSQPTDLDWTEWGATGVSKTEYTWTDHAGYCLEANTSNKQEPSGNGDSFSTIQVDTCNGSYEQKWNAPAILGVSQITNTHEGTGLGAYTGP
jgi:hypothetical protein